MRDRDAQLAALIDAASAASLTPGRLVVVQAPAGLGKTTLLREFTSQTQMRVLSAQSDEQERHLAYGLVRTLLAPVVADPDLRDRVLADGAAAAGVLFGAEPPTTVSPTGMVYALYWVITNLAQLGPIALIIDDLHEADDSSLEFLSFLARRLSDLPVFLLAATRPRSQTGPRKRLDAVEELGSIVELSPLSATSVAEIVAGRLGREPDDTFAEACQEVTGGNPFYLRELLREIEREQFAPTADSAGRVHELGPASIVRGILLTLGSVANGSADMARACAVLGDNARFDDAVAVAGLGADDAVNAADALVAAEILTSASSRLSFAHPILRSAVLADLGPHGRARWHSRAAARLSSVGGPVQVVAGHLLAVDPSADQTVVVTLRAAATEAMHAGSPATAQLYLARALEEPPERYGDVVYELGVAEMTAGDIAAIEHLKAGIDGADSDTDRCRRAIVFAEGLRKIGAIEMALDTLDQVRDKLGPDDVPIQTELMMERYWIARTSLRGIHRLEAEDDSLVVAAQSDDTGTRLRANAYLALERTLGDAHEEASANLDRAVAGPGLLAVDPPDSAAFAALLLTLTVTEQHETFKRVARTGLDMAGRDGNVVAHLVVSIYRAMESLRLGHIADARLESEAAMQLASTHGWPQGSPELPAIHVCALIGLGELDLATATLNATPFSIDDPCDYPSLLLLDARAQLRLAQRDWSGALADLTLCGARMDALRITSPLMLAWREHTALVLLALDRRDEATAQAREAANLAADTKAPIAKAYAQRVFARTLGGDDAVDILRGVDEALSDVGPVGEQAHVWTDLGIAMRRQRRITDARTYLAKALDRADRLGAAPLAELIRAELLAAGGRPRRTRLTGVEALTASEARMVRLAAGGATNSEIAQTAFISRKTVERHLTSAYLKLGITSRTQLSSVDLEH